MEVLASSASRGSAPPEGLELLLSKSGCTGPLVEPRHGPQAGKSRYPRSQEADSSPRAQGALQTWLQGEAKGQVRSAAGPNRLRPRLTHGD